MNKLKINSIIDLGLAMAMLSLAITGLAIKIIKTIHVCIRLRLLTIFCIIGTLSLVSKFPSRQRAVLEPE